MTQIQAKLAFKTTDELYKARGGKYEQGSATDIGLFLQCFELTMGLLV